MHHNSLLRNDLKKNWLKYLMVLPVLLYLALFCYKPMYGIIIAFQKYRPALGISRSKFVGLTNFKRFLGDAMFWRAFRNTFVISGLTIIFSFPAPIILALLLNEVRNEKFKKVVQQVTYLPHFVAMVVVCGLITSFCQTNGLFGTLSGIFTGEKTNLLLKSKNFYPIYVLSDIWKEVGWNSIIYLAALAGIDQDQYEAAKIDGASRLQQIWYVTLPSLLPTISLLFILRMGSILAVGYEKILLLYNPLTYDVADVISTYVYRKGLIDSDFSYSTAIGLFNSLINILFLTITNKVSKKMGQSGLF